MLLLCLLGTTALAQENVTRNITDPLRKIGSAGVPIICPPTGGYVTIDGNGKATCEPLPNCADDEVLTFMGGEFSCKPSGSGKPCGADEHGSVRGMKGSGRSHVEGGNYQSYNTFTIQQCKNGTWQNKQEVFSVNVGTPSGNAGD